MSLTKEYLEQTERLNAGERPAGGAGEGAGREEETDAMEMVLKHMGGLGRYQRWMFLAMLPVGLCFAFVYCVQMFVTATPQQHWCRVPELQHLDIDLRRNLSIPGAVSGGQWDRCVMFDANWTLVLETLKPPGNDTPTVPCRHGWEFLFEDIPYPTIVSEREWVCDKAGYATIAQVIFFAGSLVGCALFGWMGDRFGRIPAIMGANLVGCVGGIASIYTTGLWDFAVCRFLVGMANDCCFVMMYILGMEFVGPDHRTLLGNVSMALYFGGGSSLLPWLALWVADWRLLLWITSLPMLLVLAAPFTLLESARWYASAGKIDKAVGVLKKFEKVNNAKIPQETLDYFIRSAEETKRAAAGGEEATLLSTWRWPALRRAFLVLIAVAMVATMAPDALMRMSETIGNDFFVTFFITSIVETMSLVFTALVLDKWGRRAVGSGSLGISGTLLIISAFVPLGMPQLVVTAGARFTMTMSLGALLQLAPELLPTPVRASGTSLVHIIAYIAVAFSPVIVYSGRWWQGLPLVVVGVLTLLSGGAALLLPETKGRAMPQTLADGDRLARDYSLCGKVEKDTENGGATPMKPLA